MADEAKGGDEDAGWPGRDEGMREVEGSRVDGGLLGKSNILHSLQYPGPSRACKIPLRANRTALSSPPASLIGSRLDNESRERSSSARFSRDHIKWTFRSSVCKVCLACISRAAERREVCTPDATTYRLGRGGACNERSFAPKPGDAPHHRWCAPALNPKQEAASEGC